MGSGALDTEQEIKAEAVILLRPKLLVLSALALFVNSRYGLMGDQSGLATRDTRITAYYTSRACFGALY